MTTGSGPTKGTRAVEDWTGHFTVFVASQRQAHPTAIMADNFPRPLLRFDAIKPDLGAVWQVGFVEQGLLRVALVDQGALRLFGPFASDVRFLYRARRHFLVDDQGVRKPLFFGIQLQLGRVQVEIPVQEEVRAGGDVQRSGSTVAQDATMRIGGDQMTQLALQRRASGITEIPGTVVVNQCVVGNDLTRLVIGSLAPVFSTGRPRDVWQSARVSDAFGHAKDGTRAA